MTQRVVHCTGFGHSTLRSETMPWCSMCGTPVLEVLALDPSSPPTDNLTPSDRDIAPVMSG